MAITADDVFKVITHRKRDYTVTYGGKVIDDEGNVLKKGGRKTNILSLANWHKGVLKEAQEKEAKEKEAEEEEDDLSDYEGEDEQDEDDVSYTTIIRGVIQFIKDKLIPTKKRELEPGLYLERGYKIYEYTKDGKWFEHGLEGSKTEKTGDFAKALAFTVQYEDTMEPIEFGSPEFFEALDRQAFTTWKRTWQLYINYSGPKAAENIVEFIGDLVTNVADLPIELARGIFLGEWEELKWDQRTRVTFTKKYGRQLAEQMLDKGNPNLDQFLQLITEVAIEFFLIEGLLTKTISKTGKITKEGNLAIEAFNLEGQDVNWDEFYKDPEGYVKRLRDKYQETPPIPKDVPKVSTRTLNRLKGTTAIPASAVRVDTTALKRKPFVWPKELPKVKTKELKRRLPRIPENTQRVTTTPLARRAATVTPATVRVSTTPLTRKTQPIPTGTTKVRTNPLTRKTQLIPAGTTKVRTNPLSRRVQPIPTGTTKVKTNALRRRVQPIPSGTTRVITTPLNRRTVSIPTTTTRVTTTPLIRKIPTISPKVKRVKTKPLKRKKPKYSDYAIMVRTRRLERLSPSKRADITIAKSKIRVLGRKRIVEVSPGVFRVETKPLPRLVTKVLDTLVGKVQTRILQRRINIIAEGIARVKTRVLRPLRTIKAIRNTHKVKTRTLKRLGKPIPSLVTRVKTKVLHRLKHSAIAKIPGILKTRPLKRITKAILIADAIRVSTRPLRRLTLAPVRAAIKIPVGAIRVLNKLSRPLTTIALALPRILFRVLKRHSKFATKVDAKIKLAKTKIKVLKRKVTQAIPSTVARVSVRVLPRLHLLQRPEPRPAPVAGPLNVPTVDPITGRPQYVPKGILRSAAPVRGAGRLKEDVLGVGSQVYGPGTGQQKARGYITASDGGAVSDKIRLLMDEGKPQKQAVAIALDYKRRGKL